MSERRHAADGVAGDLSYPIGVDPLALLATCSGGEFPLVELIPTAHVGHHHLAIDSERKTLHDLTDITTDGVGRINRSSSPFRERRNRDVEPEALRSINHSPDRWMVFHVHIPSTSAGPAVVSTAAPVAEQAAATR